jgi:hypothetical protein
MKAKPYVKQAEPNCDSTPGGESGSFAVGCGFVSRRFSHKSKPQPNLNPPLQAKNKKQHV